MKKAKNEIEYVYVSGNETTSNYVNKILKLKEKEGRVDVAFLTFSIIFLVGIVACIIVSIAQKDNTFFVIGVCLYLIEVIGLALYKRIIKGIQSKISEFESELFEELKREGKVKEL